MSRRYKNPPVIEALCDFRFVPSKPWDMTFPGLFYNEIKKQFPEKEEETGFEFSFRSTSAGGVEQKFEKAFPKLKFYNAKKTALIQLLPDRLIINHLKPYPGWEQFKPVIFDNLKKYRKVLSPKGLRRIGVRYINEINFKAPAIKMETYFKFYPELPEALPQRHRSFKTIADIPYNNEQDNLRLTLFPRLTKEPDTISIIFDLDYFIINSEAISSFEEVPNWIERAHTEVEKAFEACITDKTRKLFEEE